MISLGRPTASGTSHIYVDGVRVRSSSLVHRTAAVTELLLGTVAPGTTSSQNFVGRIDDLRVYDRALGDADIRPSSTARPDAPPAWTGGRQGAAAASDQVQTPSRHLRCVTGQTFPQRPQWNGSLRTSMHCWRPSTPVQSAVSGAQVGPVETHAPFMHR